MPSPLNASLPYTFKFDAVGHVVETDFATAGYYFVYGGDGLLYYRQGPYKVQNISRDGVGRVIYSGQSMAGTTYLTENPRWNPDGTQSGNSITRNGATNNSDGRSYGYDLRSRLTSSSFGYPVGNTAVSAYQFDGGATGGLGLRTGINLSGLTGTNAASFGNFARLGSMSVSGSLTNNSVGTPVAQTYDAAGNVTTRTAGGSTDTMTWDAFGQLVRDVRTGTGSFTWSAVYDGLGRRLQTTQGSLTVQSSYDPEIEFLELVTTINGVRNWHVTGPDLDGRYGGLNGCGGVEAIYNQSTSSATYLLSDTYGHSEGTLSGTTFVWNPTQCDGYGALPGTTKPSALIAGANVASQLGWRGHYIDPTGFYYMGARNYAPDSGTFLSPDPLGHSASMDLYSYCNGDPVNNFDSDGRFGVGALTGQTYNNASSEGAHAGLLTPLTLFTQAASSLVLQDTLLNQTVLGPVNQAITAGISSFVGASQGNGYTTAPNYTSQNLVIPIGHDQVKDYNVPMDSQTLQANNGQQFYTPPQANYQTVLNTAQANGPLNYSGAKSAIGLNGSFDYQRNNGMGSLDSPVISNLTQNILYPANNVFRPAYTDASNYSVGVYMRGAGYTLLASDLTGLVYASTHDNPNPLSPQLHQWWANGWNDANARISK